MKEIRDIIKAYDEAVARSLSAALATVVCVEGSSYRREGARMLITEDGRLTGAISGGCLEGDALRKAMLVIQNQQPTLVTYDTTDDDDAKLGLGLGCNGIIHLLIEPILNNRTVSVIDLFNAAVKQRRNAVIVTTFSPGDRKAANQGTYFLLSEDGILSTTSCLPEHTMLIEQAKLVLHTGISVALQLENYTALIEVLQPSVSLCVIGAGNDAIPLTEMAAVLGWKIILVDGRPNYATPFRFPKVNSILVAKPDEALRNLVPDEQTAFVLMTHNYNYDLAILQQLLPTNVPYIGMLGPSKKLHRMYEELEENGIEITVEQRSKVHGPVGLDIGASTAEEIALSILAEIRSVLANKDARPLNQLETPIHHRHTIPLITVL